MSSRRALTEKLMTYALGRGLERYDRPAVQSVNRRLAAEGYRFSALVMGIVESMPFQMRRGEGPRSMITRKHLPRRTFLRGLGAAVALPMLDAMTPAFAGPVAASARLPRGWHSCTCRTASS